MVARESVEASGLWAKPGYQIAYGMCIDAKDGKIGHYDPKAMTLFDYRTDRLEDVAARRRRGPAVVCVRCPPRTTASSSRRLRWWVRTNGGSNSRRCAAAAQAPRVPRDQVRRVHRARGGTATSLWAARSPTRRSASSPSEAPPAFVHPATGHQLCRMLASAPLLVDALSTELRRPDFDPDAAAAAGHAALWPRANRLQRDFAVFGGEFLGSQPVEILEDSSAPSSPSIRARGAASWRGGPGCRGKDHATYVARIHWARSSSTSRRASGRRLRRVPRHLLDAKGKALILRSIFTPVFEIGVGHARHDAAARAPRGDARHLRAWRRRREARGGGDAEGQARRAVAAGGGARRGGGRRGGARERSANKPYERTF